MRYGVEPDDSSVRVVPAQVHIWHAIVSRRGCKVKIEASAGDDAEIEAMRNKKPEGGAQAVAAFGNKDGKPDISIVLGAERMSVPLPWLARMYRSAGGADCPTDPRSPRHHRSSRIADWHGMSVR